VHICIKGSENALSLSLSLSLSQHLLILIISNIYLTSDYDISFLSLSVYPPLSLCVSLFSPPLLERREKEERERQSGK
jgi:hypothetical protein